MNAASFWGTLDGIGFQVMLTLLSVLWQSSILLGAVALLSYVLRRRRPSVRHALWVGALLAAPLLPVLALAARSAGTPQAQIPVVPSYVPPAVEFLVPPAEAAVPPLPEATHPAEAVAPVEQEEPRVSLRDYPWAVAFLGYAAGAALFLSLVFVGRFRLHRWIQGGAAVTEAGVLTAFQGARSRLRLRRNFRLVATGKVQSPITIGTLRPSVLLPAGLAQKLSDSELEAVAVHELTHVKRNDPLLLGLASLVRAVLFFHPLVWLACRQISNLAEAACDDAVLDATGEPVSYAKMLTRLAEELPRRSTSTELSAGIVLSKSAFLRRVEAILSERRGQIRKLSRLALAATLLGILLSLVISLALPIGEKHPADAAEAGELVGEVAKSGAQTWGEAVEGISFGPVIERVVNDDSVTKDVYIDLDNGKLFTRPEDVVGFQENLNWFRERGIDALCDTDPLVAGLVGIDMVVHPLPERVWETMNAKELAGQELWAFAKAGLPVYISVKGDLPATYVFKTREGGMGILQIVGFTDFPDDPPGVKIRYKMVQAAAEEPAEKPEGEGAAWGEAVEGVQVRLREYTEEEREVLRQLEQKVSLALDDTPLTQVIGFLQEVTPVNYALYRQDLPADLAPITLNIETTLRNALDMICELAGMGWKVDGPVIKIASPERLQRAGSPRVGAIPPDMQEPLGKRVSVAFDTPLPTVLEFMTEVTPLDYQLVEEDLPPELAHIRINVECTLAEFLDLLCELAELSWMVEGGIIKIGKAETLQRQIRGPLEGVGSEPGVQKPDADEEKPCLRTYDINDLLLVAFQQASDDGRRSVRPKTDKSTREIQDRVGGGVVLPEEHRVIPFAVRLWPSVVPRAHMSTREIQDKAHEVARLLKSQFPFGAVGPVLPSEQWQELGPENLPRMSLPGVGRLTVIATPLQHARIEEILREMREGMYLQVNLEMRVFVGKKGMIPRQAAANPAAAVSALGLPEDSVVLAATDTRFRAVTRKLPDRSFFERLQAQTLRLEASPSITLLAGQSGSLSFALNATEVTAMPLVDQREVFVRLVVKAFKDSMAEAFSVSAAVPDGGFLVVVDEGPLAGVVASIWLGEEAGKDLDLANCAIVLLVRPRTILLEEGRAP